MLVWMTSIAGSAVLVVGGVLMSKVDRRWRRVHLQCCRCLAVWFGREKLCRCGGSGNSYDWLARRYAGFPTHDWQGYLDTAPIRTVDAHSTGFAISGTTIFDDAFLHDSAMAPLARAKVVLPAATPM